MGAAATRCGVPLGAALFNAGERDDGAGERERVRDDGLPSLGAIVGSARWCLPAAGRGRQPTVAVCLARKEAPHLGPPVGFSSTPFQTFSCSPLVLRVSLRCTLRRVRNGRTRTTVPEHV